MQIADGAEATRRFRELLGEAESGPESVDFTELRLACAASSDYDPYWFPGQQLEEFERALADADLKRSEILLGSLLAAAPLDIDLRFRADRLYEALGQSEKVQRNASFVQRLVRSVLASGDGKGADSAFQVISVREEYALLAVLELEPIMQALMGEGGHSYDVLTARNRQDGRQTSLYFNIDLLRG